MVQSLQVGFLFGDPNRNLAAAERSGSAGAHAVGVLEWRVAVTAAGPRLDAEPPSGVALSRPRSLAMALLRSPRTWSLGKHSRMRRPLVRGVAFHRRLARSCPLPRGGGAHRGVGIRRSDFGVHEEPAVRRLAGTMVKPALLMAPGIPAPWCLPNDSRDSVERRA
jgi:hypothetical protein